MKILAWTVLMLRRLPSSSELLGNFSRLVENDGSRSNIERCLEAVLHVSLKRTVAVIPVVGMPKGEEKPRHDDAWDTDRRVIEARIAHGELGAPGVSQLARFGGVPSAPARVAALVPVLSSKGSLLATVVIGKRRFLTLAEAERSLIAAAVGMATLLFEQARLRDAIGVATQAGTVKDIVESHRRQAKSHLSIDDRSLN